MEKIAIVGGGLSGSLIAVYLAKRGFDVHLFEKRPDMRKNNISAGRSINLALSERGINALKKVGIDKQVLATGITMAGTQLSTLWKRRTSHLFSFAGAVEFKIGGTSRRIF